MVITAIDHGTEGAKAEVKLLIDSGVHNTLLSEADWQVVGKQRNGVGKVKLKVNRTKFRPFGTNFTLPIIGRSKCRLWELYKSSRRDRRGMRRTP